MKRICLYFWVIVIILFSGSVAHGQKKTQGNKEISKFKGFKNRFIKGKRYYSVGVSVNALNYFGDIAPKSSLVSTDLSFTRPGFSAFVTRRLGPFYSLRASLSYGRLKADDFESADPFDENARFRYIRNLSFRNDIKELAITGIFDLFPNNGNYLTRANITPYASIGLAIFHHNPKALAPETDLFGAPLPEAGKWVALQPLGTEGQYSDHYSVKPYKLIQPSIPISLGVRYKLNQNLDLAFEIGYRYLFFDYIDDVSANYVDLGAIDGNLAKTMSDRSMEPTSASGKERNPEAVFIRVPVSYTGYDGQTYTTLPGFGREHVENNRGSRQDNDIYIVTSFHLSYIIGSSFRKAKFR